MQLPIKKALSKEYKRACAASPVEPSAGIVPGGGYEQNKSFASVELEL